VKDFGFAEGFRLAERISPDNENRSLSHILTENKVTIEVLCKASG
jgi:hypothetical protein